MNHPIPTFTRVLIETEENEVVVLACKPCKTSALSTENDGLEYFVENEFGQVFWIPSDSICDNEEI